MARLIDAFLVIDGTLVHEITFTKDGSASL
jgi:hypothetical protein